MSNTDQPTGPRLERGQIVPAFTLPGTDGMPHSPWDYKQRNNFLLLFIRTTTGNEGPEMLRGFAQYYATFREELCAILAITADPVIVNLHSQQVLQLPFPLVSNVQGGVIKQYTRWEQDLTPSIVLADRYGAVYEHWIAEDGDPLPSIQYLLETLQYLNRLCTP